MSRPFYLCKITDSSEQGISNTRSTTTSSGNTTKDGKQILHHKGANSKHERIKNDSMSDEDFMEFIKSVLSNIFLYNNGAWYFSFCDLKLDLILNPLKSMGYEWKSIIIWKKNQATLSGKDYKSRYEPIVYGCPPNSFFGLVS